MAPIENLMRARRVC